jgi:anti-sigma factor RsiW
MRDRAECEAVVRQMWAYLDNVIPVAEREAVSSHVATCVDCAAHFEFAAEFLRAVAARGLSRPSVESLHERIRRALANEHVAKP